MTERHKENFEVADERILDSSFSKKELVNETVSNLKLLDIDVTDKITTTTKSILSSVENVGADATDSSTTHVVDQTDINAKVNL